MPQRSKVIAFDVDAASLTSLRQALPGWQINEVYGATVASLPCDWNPGATDLLVVGVRANVSETLGLCRFLAYCTPYSREFRVEAAGTSARRAGPFQAVRRPDAPLLVLLAPGQNAFMRAALEAGAHSCLVLPICAKEVVSLLARAAAGNQQRCPTFNLEQAQHEEF